MGYFADTKCVYFIGTEKVKVINVVSVLCVKTSEYQKCTDWREI